MGAPLGGTRSSSTGAGSSGRPAARVGGGDDRRRAQVLLQREPRADELGPAEGSGRRARPAPRLGGGQDRRRPHLLLQREHRHDAVGAPHGLSAPPPPISFSVAGIISFSVAGSFLTARRPALATPTNGGPVGHFWRRLAPHPRDRRAPPRRNRQCKVAESFLAGVLALGGVWCVRYRGGRRMMVTRQANGRAHISARHEHIFNTGTSRSHGGRRRLCTGRCCKRFSKCNICHSSSCIRRSRSRSRDDASGGGSSSDGHESRILRNAPRGCQCLACCGSFAR